MQNNKCNRSLVGIDFRKAYERLKAGVADSERGIKDVAILMIPQVGKSITGFFTSILLARGLGPAMMGQYALITSVSETVTTLSDLGIGQTAIRFGSLSASVGDQPGHLAVLRWAFWVRIALVTAMILAVSIAAPYLAVGAWRSADLTPLIRIGLLPALFGAISSVPIIYFQSLKRFGMNATVLTGQSFILLLGILAIEFLHLWSVLSVILATSAAAALASIVFILLVPKAAFWPSRGPRLRFSRKFWRVPVPAATKDKALDNTSADRFAVYMLLSTAIVLISMRVDVWLMGVYLSKDEIGLYNAAYRLALPLTLVLGAFNTAIWPRAAALTRPNDAKALLRRTTRASFLLASMGVVYALAFPLLAPFLFGDAYQKSTLLAQVLSLGYCISIATNPIGVVGYGLGMARVYWIINLVQLFLVIVLLVVLLPRIGPLGGAIAFIANTLVGSVICLVLIWRKARSLPSDVATGTT